MAGYIGVQAQQLQDDGRSQNGPSLADTLQWLSGATQNESGNGFEHHEIETDGCKLVITEYRAQASPGFWIRESFSLKDIDPYDIKFEETSKGTVAVTFHTTNYTDKIVHTSWTGPQGIRHKDYIFYTTPDFAPRFVKALDHAAKLCGGKASAF